jgi:hypothetical protein
MEEDRLHKLLRRFSSNIAEQGILKIRFNEPAYSKAVFRIFSPDGLFPYKLSLNIAAIPVPEPGE